MQKYLMLGDSISIHYGTYLKKMLDGLVEFDSKPGILEALKNLDMPAGSSCGDSGQVLEYLSEKNEKKELRYDLVTLNCGLHDVKTDPRTGEMQVPIGCYEEHLRKIFSLLKNTGAGVLWIRTTGVNDRRHNERTAEFKRHNKDIVEYNATADSLVREFQFGSIDLYTFTRQFGDAAYCDHVHYVEEVRGLQAAFIAGHLYPLIAAKKR